MITNVSLTSYDEVYDQKYFDCEFKTEFTQINIRYWMYKKEIYGITYKHFMVSKRIVIGFYALQLDTF